jgi:hypothetical protein
VYECIYLWVEPVNTLQVSISNFKGGNFSAADRVRHGKSRQASHITHSMFLEKKRRVSLANGDTFAGSTPDA